MRNDRDKERLNDRLESDLDEAEGRKSNVLVEDQGKLDDEESEGKNEVKTDEGD